MRFTIEVEPFIRMVEETKGKASPRKVEPMLRLVACQGRVYVENSATVAETDAAVTEEGQCKVASDKLLRMLRDMREQSSADFEADTAWLRSEQHAIPVSGYTAYAVAPTRFHVYLSTEAGMVPSKFLLKTLAQEI